jgi:hypothetical protein
VNTLIIEGKGSILNLIGDKPRLEVAIVANDLPMASEIHPSGRDRVWMGRFIRSSSSGDLPKGRKLSHRNALGPLNPFGRAKRNLTERTVHFHCGIRGELFNMVSHPKGHLSLVSYS